jgi:type II secretory pathway component PulC
MDIAEVARLQPSRGPKGAFQLQLFPAGDEAAFEALGFRSGDVLVSINGRAAPANLAELSQTLAGLEDVPAAEIVVERGGARVPLDMTFEQTERILSQ